MNGHSQINQKSIPARGRWQIRIPLLSTLQRLEVLAMPRHLSSRVDWIPGVGDTCRIPPRGAATGLSD